MDFSTSRLSKQIISKNYFWWFSNFYSSSFLRLLATANKLPNTPNPRPANPVLVSASPVFAKRLVDFSTLAVDVDWLFALPSGLIGVTFLKIYVTTSSLISVLLLSNFA